MVDRLDRCWPTSRRPSSIDGFFRGAAFCKYVCPIGQFNFVQSLVSPLEVKVRDPDVCCIVPDQGLHPRAQRRSPAASSTCTSRAKSSNMDCTFCLDCIHACPHENIGVIATMPASTLAHDRAVPAWAESPGAVDLAALCVVLVAAAFVNAALMTEPLLGLEDRVMSAFPLQSPRMATSCLVSAGTGALTAGDRLGRSSHLAVVGSFKRVLDSHWDAAFAYALVPLGFGMWLAHYTFHFVTSYASLLPIVQRFLVEKGSAHLRPPDWTCTACAGAPTWLLRLEIVFLDLGLLFSLYTAHRIALRSGIARRDRFATSCRGP